MPIARWLNAIKEAKMIMTNRSFFVTAVLNAKRPQAIAVNKSVSINAIGINGFKKVTMGNQINPIGMA